MDRVCCRDFLLNRNSSLSSVMMQTLVTARAKASRLETAVAAISMEVTAALPIRLAARAGTSWSWRVVPVSVGSQS